MRGIEGFDLSSLEGVIMDFDGVFWPHGFAPKPLKYKIFTNACAWAIKDLSGTADIHEDIEQEYFDLYSVHKEKSQDMLCDKYGVDRISFQSLYNRLARENFRSESLSGGIPCLIKEMRILKESTLKYGILSHAHRNEYILPYLKDKGLSEYINTWNILGNSELNGNSKADGPEPYLMMLSILGTDPRNTIMVEDSPGNLIWAKELGMTTVWINDGDTDVLPDNHAGCVDIIADKLVDILGHLNYLYPSQGHYYQEYGDLNNI